MEHKKEATVEQLGELFRPRSGRLFRDSDPRESNHFNRERGRSKQDKFTAAEPGE